MQQYPEILAHYRAVTEKDRLLLPEGRLEFLRTQNVLLRFLPSPPAVVYDVGGGTGPYASWLASLEYETHLVDLVPEHIEEARGQASSIRSFAVADARDLPMASESADAVLLLGPLYHLPDLPDRMACWREACRIVRPGGIVVAAVISRFASLLDGMSRDVLADPEFFRIVTDDLETGIHVNPTQNPDFFTTAYLHRPDEAVRECQNSDLMVQTVAGVEGPAWLLSDLGARLDDEARRNQLLDLLERVESEPHLLGVSAHVLVVGRKPS